MKKFTNFISESISSQNQEFFANVLKVQTDLSNKTSYQKLDIDINKLTKPTAPFSWQDLKSVNEFIDLMKDNKTSPSIASEIFNNVNKYIGDTNPMILPYWFSNGNNTYLVGIVIYNDKAVQVEGFLNIIDLEASQLCNNSDEVKKAIFNDFKLYIKTAYNNKYTGMSSKIIYPDMKSNIVSLGFTQVTNYKI